MIGKPFLFLDNIKYFSMSHIEPEHINIQAVPQSIKFCFIFHFVLKNDCALTIESDIIICTEKTSGRRC